MRVSSAEGFVGHPRVSSAEGFVGPQRVSSRADGVSARVYEQPSDPDSLCSDGQQSLCSDGQQRLSEDSPRLSRTRRESVRARCSGADRSETATDRTIPPTTAHDGARCGRGRLATDRTIPTATDRTIHPTAALATTATISTISTTTAAFATTATSTSIPAPAGTPALPTNSTIASPTFSPPVSHRAAANVVGAAAASRSPPVRQVLDLTGAEPRVLTRLKSGLNNPLRSAVRL